MIAQGTTKHIKDAEPALLKIEVMSLRVDRLLEVRFKYPRMMAR